MAKIVKITAGQPFTVFVPLVILNADGTKVAVDAKTLTQVSVKAQSGANVYDVPTSSYEHFLVLQVTKDLLPVGVYDIIITAKLQGGREFRLAMQQALGVMSWDWQTNWRDYIVGDHIELCDQSFIAGEFVTDAELEELKSELREQIAAAEQAEAEAIAEKEQYAEALEHLDNIAQETSVEGIADSIGAPATGQPSTLFEAIAAGGGGGGDAQESTSQAILAAVANNNDTAIAMLKNATYGLDAIRAAITALYGGDLTATLSALKTAIGNIDIDTSDLAKAAKLQDAQDDIDALQVLVGSTTDVSTDSTIFGELAAVISAISALSIPTVQQIQNGLAKTSDLPTGYALQGSGNATQTDIANAIGTPASGQPSTLFAAIAAGGGGGGGGGDATAANQQIIIDAVKDGNDTTIGLVKDINTYGAKEAAATANKNQVISAIGDTLSVNMLATGLSAMAGVPMNNITDDGTTTAYTLNANELYYFNNRSSDLELTLDLTTVRQGDAVDFHLIVQVAAGASPLTVTIKDSNNNDVVWSWGVTPDFLGGVIYEIGIINNLALYVKYVV